MRSSTPTATTTRPTAPAAVVFYLGPQGPDGMSRLSGWIDPETRCYVEAVTAAVRPGRHLPDGTLAEVPDERSPAQRCHDGIKLGLKAGIASGEMGQHRGHPVTVIVRTTLAELDQAAHAVTNPDIPMPPPARTGGDTALPMRDLIRMGADGIHYLAVFDNHTANDPSTSAAKPASRPPINAYVCLRPRRRLYASELFEPGDHCEVHHSPDWSPSGAHRRRQAVLRLRMPTTVSLPRATAKPSSPTPAAWPGPTAPSHRKSTTLHHPDELLRGDPDPPDDRQECNRHGRVRACLGRAGRRRRAAAETPGG